MPFRTCIQPNSSTHTHVQTIGGRDELDKQKIDVVVVDNTNAAGRSFFVQAAVIITKLIWNFTTITRNDKPPATIPVQKKEKHLKKYSAVCICA